MIAHALRRLAAPLAVGLAASLPLSAHADGRAVVNADTPNEAVIHWSGERLRIEGRQLGQSYVLLDGGRAYMITGGITLSADSVISELTGGATLPVDSLDSLKPTGRHEEVAGLRGEVFIATFRDKKGKRREEEAVLSNDPVARELTAALQVAARTLARSGSAPVQAYEQRIADALQGRGVLRFGKDYKVARLEARRYAPGFFERVGATTTLPDLSGLGGLLRPPGR